MSQKCILGGSNNRGVGYFLSLLLRTYCMGLETTEIDTDDDEYRSWKVGRV